jgi:release factor glutamine methyltransferase
MKNSKKLFQHLVDRITVYDPDERSGIAHEILEKMFFLNRTEIMSEKEVLYRDTDAQVVGDIIERVNNHEPIQYILGSAHFFGRTFTVTPAVLIPRPETEEIIRIVKSFLDNQNNRDIKILDIGTGSGCIAITIAKEISHAVVFASDVSLEALSVAKQNSELHSAPIQLMHHNILKQDLPFQMFDVIVSNPPYVREQERDSMSANVLLHEPELALFVPNDEPLLFYDSVVEKSSTALVPGGMLAVEINAQFAQQVKSLFESTGFQELQIWKDISGKDRIVTGIKK